jgi:hypothetical protein
MNEREHHVHHHPDEDCVCDRPHTGSLTKRQPSEQHSERDDDDPRPDAQTKRASKPLVKYVPRVEAKPREHEHRGCDAIERQSGEQLPCSA